MKYTIPVQLNNGEETTLTITAHSEQDVYWQVINNPSVKQIRGKVEQEVSKESGYLRFSQQKINNQYLMLEQVTGFFFKKKVFSSCST